MPYRPARLLLALALLGSAVSCRITPDEIARIEAENELLRQQITRMRVECVRYRDLDLELEAPEGSHPEPEEPPAAP